jgi:hypothetical protein
MIHLGCLNGMVLVGDLCDVRVGIYVALDNQRPRLLVDNAEITGLFGGGGEKLKRNEIDQETTRCLRGSFGAGPNLATLRTHT